MRRLITDTPDDSEAIIPEVDALLSGAVKVWKKHGPDFIPRPHFIHIPPARLITILLRVKKVFPGLLSIH